MSELRPRVTGTEVEYAVGLRRYGRKYFTAATQDDLDHIVSHVTGEYDSSLSYMRNGARCYRDGYCLEYATGEDDSFWGTVANEIAGEQLVTEAAAKYVEESDKYDDFVLPKRALHYSGENPVSQTDGTATHHLATGYHVNLCIDMTRVRPTEEYLHDLGLWAATASMYTGAGGIYKESPESPARFAIAQRPTQARSGFSDNIYRFPLILMRHIRQHDDGSRFFRIQVAGIDSNISPWSSWMTTVTASLCLRAIEQKVKGRSLRQQIRGFGDEPLATLARDVALNPRLDSMTTLEDGSTISAIDIQRELWLRASKTGHTDEEASGLAEWERVLHDIDGGRAYMRDKTGWIVRKQWLDRYMHTHELTLDDTSVIARDRKWDALGKHSVASVTRSKLWSEYMDTELIRERRDKPCPNTRAVLRAEALTELKQRRESGDLNEWHVNWGSYRLGSREAKNVMLKDPLMTSLPI